MSKLNVYLEIGKKKTFAAAIDYPGWGRNAKTPQDALSALVEYAPRYAKALAETGLSVPQPQSVADLDVTAELEGNATTDFGGMGIMPDADLRAVTQADIDRFVLLLNTCWDAFQNALAQSEGIELRKGPRGGGRDQSKMTKHIIESHQAYLKKLGWKPPKNDDLPPPAQIAALKLETEDALAAWQRGELPKQGPRGGLRWPARFFTRVAAWHLLDHIWEIEDRMI